MFDDKDNEIIAFLESKGAIIWDGMDNNGEAVFRFDLEILKKVMPAMYDQIMEDIDEDLMTLYEEGLVELEYDENLNAMFRMSEKGRELFNKVDPNNFFNS